MENKRNSNMLKESLLDLLESQLWQDANISEIKRKYVISPAAPREHADLVSKEFDGGVHIYRCCPKRATLADLEKLRKQVDLFVGEGECVLSATLISTTIPKTVVHAAKVLNATEQADEELYNIVLTSWTDLPII